MTSQLNSNNAGIIFESRLDGNKISKGLWERRHPACCIRGALLPTLAGRMPALPGIEQPGAIRLPDFDDCLPLLRVAIRIDGLIAR